MKGPRPVGVGVVAWVLIVETALWLLAMPLLVSSGSYEGALRKSGTNPLTYTIIGTAEAVVTMALGVMMLRGANWARWTYIGLTPIGFALGWTLVAFHPMSVLGVILYAVFVYILTTAAASRFFVGRTD